MSADIERESLHLPGSNELFINSSLCPYYIVLLSTSKKLHCFDKIHDFLSVVTQPKSKLM